MRLQKEKKEGYLEYDGANPGEIVKRPKALYMRYFAPWNWIISASSYRDEFKELLNVHGFQENIHHLRKDRLPPLDTLKNNPGLIACFRLFFHISSKPLY